MLPDSTQECGKNPGSKVKEGLKKKETLLKTPPSTLPPPLVHYVDDPRQMIDQLFQAVGKEELQTLLPTILQNVPFEELKQLCLEQLEQMPHDVIARLLSGAEEPQPSDQSPDSTSADKDDPRADVFLVSTKGSPSPSESLELFPATEDMELLLHEDIVAKEAGEMTSSGNSSLPLAEKEGDLASSLTRMQMEILELELRARAIKALLKSQKGSEEGDKEENRRTEDDDDDDGSAMEAQNIST